MYGSGETRFMAERTKSRGGHEDLVRGGLYNILGSDGGPSI